MERDKITSEEADELIAEARKEFFALIDANDPEAHDICETFFGLEPDYLVDLL
jgi:hypothetical protein